MPKVCLPEGKKSRIADCMVNTNFSVWLCEILARIGDASPKAPILRLLEGTPLMHQDAITEREPSEAPMHSAIEKHRPRDDNPLSKPSLTTGQSPQHSFREH